MVFHPNVASNARDQNIHSHKWGDRRIKQSYNSAKGIAPHLVLVVKQPTSTVNRVLSSSSGYIVTVEHIPAVAPAIVEGGTGIYDGAPFLGVRKVFTES